MVCPAVSSGPLAIEGVVFLADAEGGVRRFDRDGRQLGRPIRLGAPVTAPLCEAPGGKLVAVTDRTVLLIEPVER